MAKVFEQLYLKPGAETPYFKHNYYLIDGQVHEWTGEQIHVKSPIAVQGQDKPVEIGIAPLQTEKEALEAVCAAHKAWGGGLGEWPQTPTGKRIEAVEKYLQGLVQKRDEIIRLLMWEICKNEEDAKKEVDRTIAYIKDTIIELKKLENDSSSFKVTGGVIGHIRRAPLGVVLCLGPFNYPFNETYTLLIPALLMGNTIVMKLPKVGVLCHGPTMELFAKIFPPGVVNMVSGHGRVMLGPMMKSGKLDCFSFIGTNAAADTLQKEHPKPHRLRVCLGLDAKNPAIVLPCANLDTAVPECILGSLSYNGQRCTAIKIIFVHESIVDQFLPRFCQAVDSLKMGLPWDKDVKITPMAEPDKPRYIRDVIDDAVSKGAKVMNPRGYQFDRAFVAPTVLYPVDKSMKVFHEEQFGPVVPVATFKDLGEISQYLVESQFGQQASVFGTDTHAISQLIDVLVNQVSRVNINTQCQRGPDLFPFTGRKDSAYGTLSVHDALRVFSIRALVAAKDTRENQDIVTKIVRDSSSNFLRMDYMF